MTRSFFAVSICAAVTLAVREASRTSASGRCLGYSVGLEVMISQPGWAFRRSIPAARSGSAITIFMAP